MSQILEPFIFEKRLEAARKLSRLLPVALFHDNRTFNVMLKIVSDNSGMDDRTLARAYDGKYEFWILLENKVDGLATPMVLKPKHVLEITLDRMVLVSTENISQIETCGIPKDMRLSDIAMIQLKRSYDDSKQGPVPLFVSSHYTVRATNVVTSSWGLPLEHCKLHQKGVRTEPKPVVYKVPRRMRLNKEAIQNQAETQRILRPKKKAVAKKRAKAYSTIANRLKHEKSRKNIQNLISESRTLDE